MKGQSKTQDRYVVVMAGGRGERFWPLSREKTPKQLVSLLGKRSFLQETVDRVLPVVPKEHVFVITNRAQLNGVRRQLPQIPKRNIIAEPIGRDTCAAVTLGAALVGARSPSGVIAVLPADHVISEPRKFRRVMTDAYELAAREPKIVTIGIKPTEPATGFGYIQFGEALSLPSGMRANTTFYEGRQFVEKPNYELAVQYLESGYYRWNAGMFVWSFQTVLEGLREHRPEMAEACERWMKKVGTSGWERALAREYPKIEKISIDYALLEKARNVVVADGDFSWDDLGAWPALAHHLKADPSGNCAVADLVYVDAERNVVFDARKKRRTPIALVGIQDSIIVQTDDATLVAHKGQAQKIKELVQKLGASKKHKHLT